MKGRVRRGHQADRVEGRHSAVPVRDRRRPRSDYWQAHSGNAHLQHQARGHSGARADQERDRPRHLRPANQDDRGRVPRRVVGLGHPRRRSGDRIELPRRAAPGASTARRAPVAVGEGEGHRGSRRLDADGGPTPWRPAGYRPRRPVGTADPWSVPLGAERRGTPPTRHPERGAVRHHPQGRDEGCSREGGGAQAVDGG